MNIIVEVNYNNQFLICLGSVASAWGYKSGLQSMFIIDTKLFVQLHVNNCVLLCDDKCLCCSSFSPFYSSIRVAINVYHRYQVICAAACDIIMFFYVMINAFAVLLFHHFALLLE